MTPWQRWVQRPQSLWVRKAFFQVHLWVGIGVGIYVMAISISGSALVYRREITRKYSRKTVAVADTGGLRLSGEELEQDVRRAYPAYEVFSIREPERRDRPADVILGRTNTRIERLFDPYTGTDLGDPESGADRLFQWLVDLHDNLLSGLTGRLVNGMGALLVTLLSLTGAILWWPGIKNWRRSVTINGKANFARFNWDVHSAIGFWCSLFVFVWGISGIWLCFPGALNFLVAGEPRFWITRLHFGRFNGPTEALWTILGLVPAILAGTGAVMWWNRVLCKKVRRLHRRGYAATSDDLMTVRE